MMSLQSGAVTTLLSLIHIVVIPVFSPSFFLFPSIMLCVICGTNLERTSVGLTSRLKVGDVLSPIWLMCIKEMMSRITYNKEWLIGDFFSLAFQMYWI